MDDQDWTPVTIKTKSAPASKMSCVIHDRPSNRAAELKKVEAADSGKPKMLTLESRNAMAAARAAKKITQKQLDMQCSFPANSCNSWESGRICPTSTQIQILHRVLGIKLERA